MQQKRSGANGIIAKANSPMEMNPRWHILIWSLSMVSIVAAGPRSPEPSGPSLRQYQSPNYVIFTDLGADQAGEAEVRMTQMSAEYRRWTGFVSGDAGRKLPLYLFAHSEDFLAAGGPQAAAGAFIGNALLAVASPGDWHTLQHEGFHQFVAAASGRDLPPWIEEGWAEYFGESVFTGDGYVSGVIPGWRLRRLKWEIANHRLKPLSQLIALSAVEWNRQFALANYDQSWSLVQFFVHGAKGRYRFAFAGFVDALRADHSVERAWADHFGDMDALEMEWQAEWLGLTDDPSRDLYAQAAVAALSSCLGRAVAQGQRFDSFSDFSRAAGSGTLRVANENWLPPSLATEALGNLSRLGASCSIQSGNGDLDRIVAILPGRLRITGTFSLRAGRVKQVRIETVAISGREFPPVPLLPHPRVRSAE